MDSLADADDIASEHQVEDQNPPQVCLNILLVHSWRHCYSGMALYCSYIRFPLGLLSYL